MGKVIFICGKICSGKTYYAKKLAVNEKAVIISIDEIMLRIPRIDSSDEHDKVSLKLEEYCYEKTEEIINCGINVILDWGFWARSFRKYVSDYFSKREIKYEWHYIDVSDEAWVRYIEKRNKMVVEEKVQAYYLDEGLMNKLISKFEKPTQNEIDVWITNTKSDYITVAGD